MIAIAILQADDRIIMNESSADDGQSCPRLLEHFTQIYPVEQWKMEGFFQDEHLLDIDCHWMEFEPTRSSVHFLLAVIYAIVFLLGFLSNTLAIYFILSSKSLLSPANILLVNLAISDLLTVLTIPIFIFNSLHQGPAIGKLGCTIYGFLTGISGTCSIMSLTAVSVERYLVISRPLNVDGKPTRRWAFLTSLSLWLYSAVFASLPFFGVGKYVPEGLLTGCSFDYMSNDIAARIFILVFFLGAWVVPLSIIVYCYSSVVMAVFHVRRDVAKTDNTNVACPLSFIGAAAPTNPNNDLAPQHPTESISIGNRQRVSNRQLDVEVKVAKVLIGLISSWAVAWTPYAVVSLVGISGHGHFLTPLSAMLPALFAKLVTCVDPFIYTLNQPKIKKEIFVRLRLLPRINSSVAPYYNYAGVSPYNRNNISPHIIVSKPITMGRVRSIAASNLSTPTYYTNRNPPLKDPAELDEISLANDIRIKSRRLSSEEHCPPCCPKIYQISDEFSSTKPITNLNVQLNEGTIEQE